jgi:hypothetical protein
MLNTVPEAHLIGADHQQWIEGVTPDLRGARRVVRQARRIECVDIGGSTGDLRATVTGVWHRLPVTRTVPVATALGLSMCGVPTHLGEALR